MVLSTKRRVLHPQNGQQIKVKWGWTLFQANILLFLAHIKIRDDSYLMRGEYRSRMGRPSGDDLLHAIQLLNVKNKIDPELTSFARAFS